MTRTATTIPFVDERDANQAAVYGALEQAAAAHGGVELVLNAAAAHGGERSATHELQLTPLAENWAP